MTNTIKATTLIGPNDTYDIIINRLVTIANKMPEAAGNNINSINFLEFYIGTLHAQPYAEATWDVSEPQPETYVAMLDLIDGGDPENAHYKADKILLRYVYQAAPEIADAYRNVINRSEAWWYA